MKAFTPYLCLLVAFACASGVPPSKRNVCDWAGTSPSIGHQYFGDSCPAKFAIASNGVDCEDNALDLVSCASFCQIRTTFSYGPEQPYTRVPLCRDGRPCQLSDTDHTIVGFNSLTNNNFKYTAIDSGVSGGWNTQNGTSRAYNASKQLASGECGYWTFIPVLKVTCGTYSQSNYDKANHQCRHPVQTVGNACVEQLQTWNDANPRNDLREIRGNAIFVFVDCTTFAPLVGSKQDAAYNEAGVALANTNRQAYQVFHRMSSYGATLAQSNDVDCGASAKLSAGNTLYASDCLNAISILQGCPTCLVSTKSWKGHPWTYAAVSDLKANKMHA